MTRLLQITLYQEESVRNPAFIWKYCNRHDWVRRYKHGLCTDCCTLLKHTSVTCRLGELLVLFWSRSQYAAPKYMADAVCPLKEITVRIDSLVLGKSWSQASVGQH